MTYCRCCRERRADYQKNDGSLLCKDCTPVQVILAGEGHWLDGRAPKISRRLVTRARRHKVTWNSGGVPA